MTLKVKSGMDPSVNSLFLQSQRKYQGIAFINFEQFSAKQYFRSVSVNYEFLNPFMIEMTGFYMIGTSIVKELNSHLRLL